jgi:hypothetical protein
MRVVSHLSAAALWGLAVPARHPHHVTVPRDQSRAATHGCVVHRADLVAAEITVHDGVLVTTPLRTVLDCARSLPFGWGLAVADSALRLRLVTRHQLQHGAARSLGPGATSLRRVCRACDHRAGSALESLTRALCLDHGIGPLELQVRLSRDGHPYDLAVVGARTLIEADGAEHHRTAARFAQDCEDMTLAAAEDHLVLRPTWYDVTRRPLWTVEAIRRTVERQRIRLRRERVAQQRTVTRRAHRARSRE